jgi:hypothetical protein
MSGDREAIFRARYNAETLDALVKGVVDSVNQYDRTGDHVRHVFDHAPDCVRCKIVESLPEWARAAIKGPRTP